MAISEAVLLVLQAGAIGKGGEVFVLDMGEQVRIIDLAHALIRLSGFEADRDIPIIFTDLAPGEKESEDLFTGEEGTQATSHDKIYSTKINTTIPKEQIILGASTLQSLAQQGKIESLVPLLQELVPTYIPSSLAISVSGPRLTAFSSTTQRPTK